MLSENNPAVVCLSGGMDSTSLLLHLLAQKRQIFGVSYDYGQKHRLELERLQLNLQYLRHHGHQIEWQVVDLSSLSTLLHSALIDDDWSIPIGHYESTNMKQTVVPNRNAIFASIAYGYAISLSQKMDGQIDFCLGVHAGDHAIYPDCRPEFYDQLVKAFAIGNWESDRVRVYLPYIHCDKLEILQDAEQSIGALSLDFDSVFRNTLTSYDPGVDGKSNGRTGSDVERILAFHRLGRRDPVEYAGGWKSAVKYALQMESQIRQAKSKSDQ